MESLIRQLQRVRFSANESENQEEHSNPKDKRIPPKKSVSFKGDKRKTRIGFPRQGSDGKSYSSYSTDGEFETAVAAAAYAINSLEGEGSQKKKPVEALDRSASKSKSYKESNTAKALDSGRISRLFSGKEAKENLGSADKTANQKMPEKRVGITPSLKKTPTFPSNGRAPSVKKTLTFSDMDAAPSMKKTPTFSDKYLNDEENKGAKAERKPPISSLSSRKQNQTTTKPSSKLTKADAWERAQMDKIKKRCEKSKVVIFEWENEKKTKAKRRLEKKEAKLELRRARAVQEHRNDISRIDKIAGGARALADERKRNEESKIREKAKEIRLKGKDTTTCFCF